MCDLHLSWGSVLLEPATQRSGHWTCHGRRSSHPTDGGGLACGQAEHQMAKGACCHTKWGRGHHDRKGLEDQDSARPRSSRCHWSHLGNLDRQNLHLEHHQARAWNPLHHWARPNQANDQGWVGHWHSVLYVTEEKEYPAQWLWLNCEQDEETRWLKALVWLGPSWTSLHWHDQCPHAQDLWLFLAPTMRAHLCVLEVQALEHQAKERDESPVIPGNFFPVGPAPKLIIL